VAAACCKKIDRSLSLIFTPLWDVFISRPVSSLALLPSLQLGLGHVFGNKFGEAMNANKWSEHNWAAPLKKLEIRHRKFYATRHTFITEMVKAGKNPNSMAPHRAFICLDHVLVQPGPEETAGIVTCRGQGTEATCRAAWKEDQHFHRARDAIGIGWILEGRAFSLVRPSSYSC